MLKLDLFGRRLAEGLDLASRLSQGFRRVRWTPLTRLAESWAQLLGWPWGSICIKLDDLDGLRWTWLKLDEGLDSWRLGDRLDLASWLAEGLD